MIDLNTYAVPYTQHPSLPKTLSITEKLEIGVKRGLEAGLLMGAYQWMLYLLNISNVLPLQLLSYGYLALVLLRSIRKSKPKLGKKHFFRGALAIGGLISFFAALTLLLIKGLATASTTANLHYLQIKTILAQAAPEAGIIFATGCIASLVFWRLFRYPKIQV